MAGESQFQNIKTPYLTVAEQASEPDTPDAGHQRLFIDDADHHLKRIDESDVVVDIEGEAGFTPSHFVLPTLAPDSNTSFAGLSEVDAAGLVRWSSGTVNNKLVWNINLPAGTYSVFMVHSKANNRGKYHFIFDGSDLGNIDGYDASGSGVFTYSSLTGLTVAGGSPVVVEMKMSDKNASSSGYYGVVYQLVLVRTGA